MSAPRPRYGVEPVATEEIDVAPPFCPHGPTLAFERFYASREPRRFFACALHRDRKGCPFFHWVDEPISPEKRERWLAAFHEANPTPDRVSLVDTLQIVRSLPQSQRGFCHSCSRLILHSEPVSAHASHVVQYRLDSDLLSHPTTLLAPHDDKKSEAQYFFSPRTCRLLLSELKRLKVTRVVCVGTPRLHEALLSPSLGWAESLLLDIDHRYASFYPPSSFQCYNMFNGYFYEEGGEGVCRGFVNSGVVAMVIDPPFGGLVRVLAKQVQRLWSMTGGEVTTLLVFPYFMEQHISAALPSLTVCDYQITYENHKHFSTSQKSSKPSPVRFFTNLPPPGLVLPRAEGYRLCKLCQRYVAPNNAHCSFCDRCTSKDGRRYIHCRQCDVCVKPGREHCATCTTCQLPGHECGARVGIGCHRCGSLEHKRRDCPQKPPQGSPSPARRGKRKGKHVDSATSKPKRKKKHVAV